MQRGRPDHRGGRLLPGRVGGLEPASVSELLPPQPQPPAAHVLLPVRRGWDHRVNEGALHGGSPIQPACL
eukprot:9033408-Alexandrium_andersonii.AAC.1